MDGCRRVLPFLLLLAVAGCGSGALTGPGRNTVHTSTTTTRSESVVDTSSTTTTTSDRTTKVVVTTPTGRRYGWNLPKGPTSPTTNEDSIYTHLTNGSCGEAQDSLNRLWRGLTTPRNSPLYQAAIDLCGGRQSSARTMFAKAAALGLEMHQGRNGSAKVDCATLRAVRSVLEQIAQEAVECTPGSTPNWPTDDEPSRDDPRTDVVEGTTSTTTETTTTTTVTTTTVTRTR